MIQRYLFVRLKPEHAAERGAIAAHLANTLAALPQVLDVTVGTPADTQAEAAWDLGATIRFASLSDCDLALHDPEHRRQIDEYLAERAQVTKSWSFEIGG